jgi:hypothetical protein
MAATTASAPRATPKREVQYMNEEYMIRESIDGRKQQTRKPQNVRRQISDDDDDSDTISLVGDDKRPPRARGSVTEDRYDNVEGFKNKMRALLGKREEPLRNVNDRSDDLFGNPEEDNPNKRKSKLIYEQDYDDDGWKDDAKKKRKGGKRSRRGGGGRSSKSGRSRAYDDDDLESIESLPEVKPPEDLDLSFRNDVFSFVLTMACGVCALSLRDCFKNSLVPPISCVTVSQYMEYLKPTAVTAVNETDKLIRTMSKHRLGRLITLQDLLRSKKEQELVTAISLVIGEFLRKHSLVNPTTNSITSTEQHNLNVDMWRRTKDMMKLIEDQYSHSGMKITTTNKIDGYRYVPLI